MYNAITSIAIASKLDFIYYIYYIILHLQPPNYHYKRLMLFGIAAKPRS